MRHARLHFWCDLTIWPLVALACLAVWLLLITGAIPPPELRLEPGPPQTGSHVPRADPGAVQHSDRR